MCLTFAYLGCYETKIYETKIQKCLMRTWFDFEQDVIDTTIDQ